MKKLPTHCAECDAEYSQNRTLANTGSWWHFDKYTGPESAGKPPGSLHYFTGSMCGPCAAEHIYASQEAFENFMTLRSVTERMTA